MKKILLLTLVSTVLFLSCDLISDGGEGADVDSTNYYTKAEVDTIFAGVQGGNNSSLILFSGYGAQSRAFYYALSSSGDSCSSTENIVQVPMAKAGTLKNFIIKT